MLTLNLTQIYSLWKLWFWVFFKVPCWGVISAFRLIGNKNFKGENDTVCYRIKEIRGGKNHLRAVLSKRSIMWATYVVENFLVAILKEQNETSDLNTFKNIPYLIQYIKNIFISNIINLNKLSMAYFLLFFVYEVLKSCLCFTWAAYLNLDT